MNGKRAKRLRDESTVSVVVAMDGTDELEVTRPHPGRKQGGTVGTDAGTAWAAMNRIEAELSKRAKEMKAPEVDL